MELLLPFHAEFGIVPLYAGTLVILFVLFENHCSSRLGGNWNQEGPPGLFPQGFLVQTHVFAVFCTDPLCRGRCASPYRSRAPNTHLSEEWEWNRTEKRPAQTGYQVSFVLHRLWWPLLTVHKGLPSKQGLSLKGEIWLWAGLSGRQGFSR